MTKFVDVDGAALWTIRQGSGPPLVLCHGGPGMWDYLGTVAEMVEDVVTVFRYDQRACGRSSGESAYTLDRAIADLDALREYFGLERWIVAGHSFGASLAMAYCLKHPDRARGLIYLSGTGVDQAWHDAYHANRAARLGPEGRRQFDALREQLRQVGGSERAEIQRAYSELYASTDLADPRLAKQVMQAVNVAGLAVNEEVNRVLGADTGRVLESDAIHQQLRNFPVETLIVHGEEDPRPAWSARHLSALIPGARFVPIPRAGHYPWIEQPDLFHQTLRSFLIERCQTIE